MKNVLEIKGLLVAIDKVVLLDKVNASINEGSFCVLTGDNGTGKSTLFNLISGYIKPQKSEGEIYLNGSLITAKPAYKIASMGLGRMFQNPRLFDNLSVLDNLLAYAKYQQGLMLQDYFRRLGQVKISERKNRKKALELLEAFGLLDKATERAYVLSYGQRKLASLACLIMSEPLLFMLDEPLAGVNSNIIKIILSLLEDLKKKGSTIFMIEHNLHLIEHLIDQHYQIISGNNDNYKFQLA